MKKLYLIAFLAFSLFDISYLCGQTTNTVTLKPNSTDGIDAMIVNFDNGCIPDGETITPGDQNYGSNGEIDYYAWTFSSNGCSNGEARSLIKFQDLALIPSNATVSSVTLKMQGAPQNSINSINVGNNYYPESPYTEQNTGWLKRATSAWDENTVTWNTQPTTTSAGEIEIPVSTSQWNWIWTDNSTELKDMVQYWVNNPSQNFGFALELQTE